ncbi:TPA: prepilin peptidase [Citrobacter braakii]
MFYYVVMVLMFAIVFSFIFPALYLKEKGKVINNCAELQQETYKPERFTAFSILMFLMPLLIFYLSGNITLSIFTFAFAIVAYTDVSARWIPDCVIYALLVISMVSVRLADFETIILSVTLYIFPALLLSIYGYIVKNESWIASGDYYVFPSIGLMILPQYAAGLMFVNLFLVILISRWVPKAPLVTIAFITFTGYQICILSGVL